MRREESDTTNKTDSMVPATISGCEYNRVLHCTPDFESKLMLQLAVPIEYNKY